MVMQNHPPMPIRSHSFHSVPMNETPKMPIFQPFYPSVWYNNERKQPRNWGNESDVKEKRFRSVPKEEISTQKSEVAAGKAASKKVEISKYDKENITTLDKRRSVSMRRPKKKKTTVKYVQDDEFSAITALNEGQLYGLLIEFTVMPADLFSNGYPELTAKDQVRIMKYSFSRPTLRRHSESNAGNKPEKEGYEATVMEEDLKVIERVCVRCNDIFYATDEEYITIEHCSYHWGRLVQCSYTCCSRPVGSAGCTTSKRHVWNGTVPGINERLEGFVETKKSKRKKQKVYALDCEMCYTVKGLELTRVALLGYDGSIVYDHFVKPNNEVVDYNTRFSGVTESDINGPNAKPFLEVQKEILGLVTEDTILVGHALENDLLALKLLHLKIVDTSLIFPHERGPPFKYSLKHLMSTHLRKPIQMSPTGHCPYEDAISCLELIHFKLRSHLGNRYFDYILQNDEV